MKRKKLLHALSDFLDREGRKQRKHRDELKSLLKKLKKKEIELEEKILQEKNERKKMRLSKEREIVKAQYVKGVNALQDIEES